MLEIASVYNLHYSHEYVRANDFSPVQDIPGPPPWPPHFCSDPIC